MNDPIITKAITKYLDYLEQELKTETREVQRSLTTYTLPAKLTEQIEQALKAKVRKEIKTALKNAYAEQKAEHLTLLNGVNAQDLSNKVEAMQKVSNELKKEIDDANRKLKRYNDLLYKDPSSKTIQEGRALVHSHLNNTSNLRDQFIAKVKRLDGPLKDELFALINSIFKYENKRWYFNQGSTANVIRITHKLQCARVLVETKQLLTDLEVKDSNLNNDLNAQKQLLGLAEKIEADVPCKDESQLTGLRLAQFILLRNKIKEMNSFEVLAKDYMDNWLALYIRALRPQIADLPEFKESLKQYDSDEEKRAILAVQKIHVLKILHDKKLALGNGDNNRNKVLRINTLEKRIQGCSLAEAATPNRLQQIIMQWESNPVNGVTNLDLFNPRKSCCSFFSNSRAEWQFIRDCRAVVEKHYDTQLSPTPM